MKVTVIVPCGRNSTYLPQQLEALTSQAASFDWEIIVSDNSHRSRGGLHRLVAPFQYRGPEIRFVDASNGVGPGYARNVAARVARGAMLAFADADDEVAPGWLQAIAEATEAHGFVASKFETRKLNHGWSFDSPQVHDVQKLWFPPYLPHAGTSGMGVRREAHESIGGFDESWPRLQDTEYCVRMHLAGNRLHFAPRAIVHVRMRTSPCAAFRQARSWARYNMLLYHRYGSGFPPVPNAWHRYWRRCKRLVRDLRATRSKEDIMRVCFSLGWQAGTLEACLRYLIPPVIAVS
jgi:glycosyltransferase involved in cell wall biosynthesis